MTSAASLLKSTRLSIKRKTHSLSHDADDATAEPLLQSDREEDADKSAKSFYTTNTAKTDLAQDRCDPTTKGDFRDRKQPTGDNMISFNSPAGRACTRSTISDIRNANHIVNASTATDPDVPKVVESQNGARIQNIVEVTYAEDPVLLATAKIHKNAVGVQSSQINSSAKVSSSESASRHSTNGRSTVAHINESTNPIHKESNVFTKRVSTTSQLTSRPTDAFKSMATNKAIELTRETPDTFDSNLASLSSSTHHLVSKTEPSLAVDNGSVISSIYVKTVHTPAPTPPRATTVKEKNLRKSEDVESPVDRMLAEKDTSSSIVAPSSSDNKNTTVKKETMKPISKNYSETYANRKDNLATFSKQKLDKNSDTKDAKRTPAKSKISTVETKTLIENDSDIPKTLGNTITKLPSKANTPATSKSSGESIRRTFESNVKMPERGDTEWKSAEEAKPTQIAERRSTKASQVANDVDSATKPDTTSLKHTTLTTHK